MTVLWVAARKGLFWFRREGSGWEQLGHGLTELNPTCVAANNGTVIVGGVNGARRSLDGGASWEPAQNGLTESHARWVTMHPQVQGLALLGTEPAAIFRSADGGASWTGSPEITALQKAGRWFLPYSPESGCVRGFAFHGERAYAAVEVGGALRSDDAGQSWRLVEGSEGRAVFEEPPEKHVHPDVHSILTHPTRADLVYAPTGGGFYRSRDGGKTWDLHYDCYCRAAWVDPMDPEHILLGPADDVDTNGRIEESRDGGDTWQPASGGLKVPWRRHMVERFAPVGDGLLAVLSNGQAFYADQGELNWARVLEQISDIRAIAVSD